MFSSVLVRRLTTIGSKAVQVARLQAKKRSKGLKTVAEYEGKRISELVSEEPKTAIIVLHGSNGDEETFTCLRDRLSRFGPLRSYLLPTGRNYAYAAFSDLSAAEAAYKACNDESTVLPLAPKPHTIAAVYTSLSETQLSFYTSISEDSVPVPGLTVLRSFLPSSDEHRLITSLDRLDWYTLTTHKTVIYPKGNPLPEWISGIIPRIQTTFDCSFDCVTACQYAPGDSSRPIIESHSRVGETVVTVSLGSNIGAELCKGEAKYGLWLPARSLLVRKNEARYAWGLSIPPRKADIYGNMTHFRGRRFSLTFSSSIESICKCSFPDSCDSVVSALFQPGRDIQRIYVRDVYEKIAQHFSHTRYKPWPKVREFIEKLSPGALALDVGCGNGRYLRSNPSCCILGTDTSRSLLSLSSTHAYPLFQSDSLRLPIRSHSFDAVLSIAVIHHFHTKDMRVQAVRELLRVVRYGGKAVIYVWAKEQVERGFQQQDCLVPWQYCEGGDAAAGTGLMRFYHVFVEFELEALISEAVLSDAYFRIDSHFYDHSNWCVLCTKSYLPSSPHSNLTSDYPRLRSTPS